MVGGDGVEVCLAGFAIRTTAISVVSQWGRRETSDSRELTVDNHGPDVAEALAVRVGVGVDPRVALEERDDLVDVRVDLALVGARREAIAVVDASKLTPIINPMHMTARI